MQHLLSPCDDFFHYILRQAQDDNFDGRASHHPTLTLYNFNVFHGADEAVGEGEIFQFFGIVAEQLTADGVNGDRIETGQDKAELFVCAGQVHSL